MKLKIKKGDVVQIISGDDKFEKGTNKPKTGRVLDVYQDKMRVLVEGVNMVKKHQKPTQTNPDGGIHEMEAPIHYSNVMLIDSDKKRTRSGVAVEETDGKKLKVRIARTNNKQI